MYRTNGYSMARVSRLVAYGVRTRFGQGGQGGQGQGPARSSALEITMG
jgi:hypothetical protein